MITTKELKNLLDGGRALVLYKDEKGYYAVADAADITTAELEDAKEELESKDKYIAKLRGAIEEAEEMLDALVYDLDAAAEVKRDIANVPHAESAIDPNRLAEKKRLLVNYLKERYRYLHADMMGRGLYDYLTSIVR